MKPTPEQINANFFGKPNCVSIKGRDGNEYDFEFQQFDAVDLFDFLGFANKWIEYSQELEKKKADNSFKIDDIDAGLMKEAMPWIEKMVSISYKDWSKEQIRQFINSNFIFLLNVMLYTNMMALTNSNQNVNDDLNKFVEEEKRKKEALKVG